MAAMGELFAPAYNRNDPAAVANVDAWMAKNFSMTNPKVEQTRTPVSFNTGNPAGMVDPEALRVLAQGGPYDMDARRNAIAAAAAAQPAVLRPATGVAAGLGANYVDPGPLLPNGVYTNDYLRHSATNPADYQKYGGDMRPDEYTAADYSTPGWYAAVNSGVGIGG